MGNKKRTSKEFKFLAKIGGYEMDNLILDLGSNVNILPVFVKVVRGGDISKVRSPKNPWN